MEVKMELVCIFLSVILGMSAAEPQEMSGKMLVFPQETDSAHVRLTASREDLSAVTVCMRYFTDLSRPTTFFSLATSGHDNDFLIDKIATKDMIAVSVRNAVAQFKGQDFQLNQWQSVCATWESASGLVQLWLDGKPSSIKFVSNSNISGRMSIILGQEQDKYGGGFDINQSFVGMISDVHMWDSVLPPNHIDNYSQNFNFPAGNVLNWNLIEFQVTGRVMVQKKQSC